MIYPFAFHHEGKLNTYACYQNRLITHSLNLHTWNLIYWESIKYLKKKPFDTLPPSMLSCFPLSYLSFLNYLFMNFLSLSLFRSIFLSLFISTKYGMKDGDHHLKPIFGMELRHYRHSSLCVAARLGIIERRFNGRLVITIAESNLRQMPRGRRGMRMLAVWLSIHLLQF